jgi:hypothetical protein
MIRAVNQRSPSLAVSAAETDGGDACRAPARASLCGHLERFPFERNRSNDKKSLKIKMLKQALIEKVYQLFRSSL